MSKDVLAKLGFTLLRLDDSKLESEGLALSSNFVLGPHHLASYLELLAGGKKGRMRSS